MSKQISHAEKIFKTLFANRSTRQRDDLKGCPFCGTKAIEQAVPYASGTLWRIMCGNPFCELDCATKPTNSLTQSEQVWEDRQCGSTRGKTRDEIQK